MQAHLVALCHYAIENVSNYGGCTCNNNNTCPVIPVRRAVFFSAFCSWRVSLIIVSYSMLFYVSPSSLTATSQLNSCWFTGHYTGLWQILGINIHRATDKRLAEVIRATNYRNLQRNICKLKSVGGTCYHIHLKHCHAMYLYSNYAAHYVWLKYTQ